MCDELERLRQQARVAENEPAEARVDEAILVAADIDGADERDAEVPAQLRAQERGNPAARGAVDVDADVPALRRVARGDRLRQRLHVLELAVVGGAHDRAHADRVLVARGRRLRRPHHEALLRQVHPARLDLHVPAQLLPAHLAAGVGKGLRASAPGRRNRGCCTGAQNRGGAAPPRRACALCPITRLGRSVGSPAARRRSCPRVFMARPASMIASLEPIVAAPVGLAPGAGGGAWNRSASIATQRCSNSAAHVRRRQMRRVRQRRQREAVGGGRSGRLAHHLTGIAQYR